MATQGSWDCGCSCWYCLCTYNGHCGKCGKPKLHPETDDPLVVAAGKDRKLA